MQQALTMTEEMQYINLFLMLMLCTFNTASLLRYVTAMCHNARSKPNPPR